MEQDILDTIDSFTEQAKQESWDFDEYKKNVLSMLLMVYSKTQFHEYIVDQMLCIRFPKYNTNNRYTLKINRRLTSENTTQLKKLQEIPKHGAQKSIEWQLKRHNHINASEANGVLGGSRTSMLISKAQPMPEITGGGVATEHGHLFEPISNMIHSHKINKIIYDFESIEHPVYSFLAASPDGITEDGELVEFKNPRTRKIVGAPKDDYWIQTQLQMEVCNLHRCHFVECCYDEIMCMEDYIDYTADYKGVVVVYHDLDEKKHTIYSPLNISGEDYNSWLDATRQKIIDHLYPEIHINIIWWGLKQYSCFVVYRDKKWFSETLPKFQEFWEEVQRCRKDPSLIPVKVRKERAVAITPKPAEQVKCLILSDDDY